MYLIAMSTFFLLILVFIQHRNKQIMVVTATSSETPPPTAEPVMILLSLIVAREDGVTRGFVVAGVILVMREVLLVIPRVLLVLPGAWGIVIPPVLQQSSDRLRKATAIDVLLQTGRSSPIFRRLGESAIVACCTATAQIVLHTTSVM